MTHKLLPNVPVMTTDIEEPPLEKKNCRYGFNKYAPSHSIAEHVQETLGLLVKTFELLSEHS